MPGLVVPLLEFCGSMCNAVVSQGQAALSGRWVLSSSRDYEAWTCSCAVQLVCSHWLIYAAAETLQLTDMFACQC